MSEILIVDDFLDNINEIQKFFESKSLICKVLTLSEANKTSSPKSILICSQKLQEKLGEQADLLNISRNIGSTNLLVLNCSSENLYKIDTELGGAFTTITYNEMDEVVREIIFQIISSEKYSFSDKKTHALIAMAKKVAKTDVTVFIHGPTGTGKEVISNFIHESSDRSEKPFVAINCAAIPENMLEAMLFGHEKGAFTGASSANKGIFRAADTGTLLLDEISEMPLSLQSKLLRVLREKKVTPIGGQRDIDVDVRVIATTNRDMVEEVVSKKFREDLYYRLNVFPIETSNLSERTDDIIPISVSLLKRHAQKNNIPFITKEAKDILVKHSWPGNVRELENVLQRAIVLCEDNQIQSKDILIDHSIKEKFYNNLSSGTENSQKVLQA